MALIAVCLYCYTNAWETINEPLLYLLSVNVLGLQSSQCLSQAPFEWCTKWSIPSVWFSWLRGRYSTTTRMIDLSFAWQIIPMRTRCGACRFIRSRLPRSAKFWLGSRTVKIVVCMMCGAGSMWETVDWMCV